MRVRGRGNGRFVIRLCCVADGSHARVAGERGGRGLRETKGGAGDLIGTVTLSGGRGSVALVHVGSESLTGVDAIDVRRGGGCIRSGWVVRMFAMETE